MKRQGHVSQVMVVFSVLAGLLLPLVCSWPEEECSFGKQFASVTSLPTRLTAYNAHDDAAAATYTCCRPDQKEQIEKALKANADFLNLFPNSDYADDTLMHMARVYRVVKDYRKEVECLEACAVRYPDSDLADDALWLLSNLYAQDWERAKPGRLQALTTIVTRYPYSTYADDALFALSQMYTQARNEQGAIGALRQLTVKYPRSELCDEALSGLAAKYMEVGNYPAAIDAYNLILNAYPYSKCADDALLGIGNAYRSAKNVQGAAAAFLKLGTDMPGSTLVRTAARELNAMRRGNFDLSGTFLCDTAEAAFKEARHYELYGQFDSAIRLYRQFLNTYRGNDHYAEAFFNIGTCYEKMNMLLAKINKSTGPEDLFRLLPDFRDAVGSRKVIIPTGKKLDAANDAMSVFLSFAQTAVGSDLRAEAFDHIAAAYEESGDAESEAMALQQMLVSFPGSKCELKGMYKVLKYYANPANYAKAAEPYRALSRTYPDVFPADLIRDKTAFLSVMNLYFKQADYAWLENHIHHIGYLMNVQDLIDEAVVARAYLYLRSADPDKARRMLTNMDKWYPQGDLTAPALFLLGQTYQRMGDVKRAREAYTKLTSTYKDPKLGTTYKDAGLSDDAERCLQWLDKPDQAKLDRAFQLAGADAANMDAYVGENVVVLAPYLVSPTMREYNMPNIWDAAYENLKWWTSDTPTGKDPLVIVLDENNQASGPGNPIRIAMNGVGNPPNWHLGLYEMAATFVCGDQGKQFGPMTRDLMAALAQLGAAALQYNLVSETRDTIGSPSAVKLAHEDVLRMKEGCLKALDDYIRRGPDVAQLNSQILTGMLIRLLDDNGYGKNDVLDWTPYRKFIQVAKQVPETAAADPATALAYCMDKAFNANVSATLKQWGFPISDQAGPQLFGLRAG